MELEDMIKTLKEKGYSILKNNNDNILACKNNVYIYLEKLENKKGLYVLTDDSELLRSLISAL